MGPQGTGGEGAAHSVSFVWYFVTCRKPAAPRPTPKKNPTPSHTLALEAAGSVRQQVKISLESAPGTVAGSGGQATVESTLSSHVTTISLSLCLSVSLSLSLSQSLSPCLFLEHVAEQLHAERQLLLVLLQRRLLRRRELRGRRERREVERRRERESRRARGGGGGGCL